LQVDRSTSAVYSQSTDLSPKRTNNPVQFQVSAERGLKETMFDNKLVPPTTSSRGGFWLNLRVPISSLTRRRRRALPHISACWATGKVLGSLLVLRLVRVSISLDPCSDVEFYGKVHIMRVCKNGIVWMATELDKRLKRSRGSHLRIYSVYTCLAFFQQRSIDITLIDHWHSLSGLSTSSVSRKPHTLAS